MNGVVIRLFITKKTAHAAGSGTGKWYPVEAMQAVLILTEDAQEPWEVGTNILFLCS